MRERERERYLSNYQKRMGYEGKESKEKEGRESTPKEGRQGGPTEWRSRSRAEFQGHAFRITRKLCWLSQASG